LSGLTLSRAVGFEGCRSIASDEGKSVSHSRLVSIHSRAIHVAVVLATLALGGFGPSTAAADPILAISPSPTVLVGDSFSLQVGIEDVADLYGYQFGIRFNPQILSGQHVAEGAFLAGAGPTSFVPGVIDNDLGLISFTADTLLGPISGATGSGSLLSVEFAARMGGTSIVSLLFDSNNGDDLLNSSLASIRPSASRNASVTVRDVQTPEPSTLLLVLVGVLGLRTRWRANRHLAVAVPGATVSQRAE